MKFEEVLPALRAGRKIRQKRWLDKSMYWIYSPVYEQILDTYKRYQTLSSFILMNDDDWEIIPEPKRLADYLIRDGWSGHTGLETWHRERYEVGAQPAGAVLLPGSEFEAVVYINGEAQ